MKAITIKQPWASLICKGIKDIENRTWKTNFRGRILVHCGAKRLKYDNWYDSNLSNDQLIEIPAGMPIPCVNSAIIGSVEIIDCVQNYSSIWAEKGVWNWVLANAKLFPQAIPYKGKLSFWDYPGINSEFDKDGYKVCMCTMNVEEKAQVMSIIDHFECRYCGGRWYK